MQGYERQWYLTPLRGTWIGWKRLRQAVKKYEGFYIADDERADERDADANSIRSTEEDGKKTDNRSAGESSDDA